MSAHSNSRLADFGQSWPELIGTQQAFGGGAATDLADLQDCSSTQKAIEQVSSHRLADFLPGSQQNQIDFESQLGKAANTVWRIFANRRFSALNRQGHLADFRQDDP